MPAKQTSNAAAYDAVRAADFTQDGKVPRLNFRHT
jgi:hypothetical protein